MSVLQYNVCLCVYIHTGVYFIFTKAENPGKQPVILTLRQYTCMCISMQQRMAQIGGDFNRLSAFEKH